MCPIFVGSVHNFGRSDNDIMYLVIKCLFPIDAYVFWCPTWSKNLGRYLVTMYACISCSNEYQGVKPLTSTYHNVYNSEFCLELKRSYFSQSIFFYFGYQNRTSTACINFDQNWETLLTKKSFSSNFLGNLRW